MPDSFDPRSHSVMIDRRLRATFAPAQEDPAPEVDGLVFGVADMAQHSPHSGEMHPDGDEVLYLIKGRVRVTLEQEQDDAVDMGPGQGMIVPKGVWHRVDILEPSRIVYLTPGTGNQYRT